MNALRKEIARHADPSQVAGLSRFFKTGPGEYGEGDRFLGIKVPVIREVVRRLWTGVSFDELDRCLADPFHEVRMAALLTLVRIFRHASKDEPLRRRCVEFYLAHMSRINNWDLVDLSCYEILGRWLAGKDARLLRDLARNGKTVWERRIGMVSTMAFLRTGRLEDTYAIAEIYLETPAPLADLLQKAGGWLLREAGKRDPDRLRSWLEAHKAHMPRTMLRYAIEKFDAPLRRRLLAKETT